jgi:8-oxo-dGTP pyrophosphatase MutT (NUDIX family)
VERIDSKTVYEGRIASVRVDRFRYSDGSTAEREIVAHPGAVAIVAHDGEQLYLVRQPREAVGEEALLELPAGKLDVPGESPLDCAKRELAEEVGVEADDWRELKRIYTSPGFAEELVHIFIATGLREIGPNPDAEERLQVVRVPLAELDRAIVECMDSKSLIGLLLLKAEIDS